jgi:hypothetical protein
VSYLFASASRKMLLRISVAVVFAAGAFGQALIEFASRMKLRMDTGRPGIPGEEMVLRRERISTQGGMMRFDAGDQFLLYKVADRSVVLANNNGKSFFRATIERVAQPLKDQRALRRQRIQAPNAVALVEGTVFVYSVPLPKPIGEAQTVQRSLELDLVSDIGGRMGAEMVAKCFQRDRLIVRTLTKVETKMSAPVAMRMTTDAIYEAIRYEEGPLAADLFVVPADWTEAPAQWLPQRVLQFLKPPAAIQ